MTSHLPLMVAHYLVNSLLAPLARLPLRDIDQYGWSRALGTHVDEAGLVRQQGKPLSTLDTDPLL